MRVMQSKFGEIDGQAVSAFTMENNNGLKVTCISYGCIITEILTPDSNGTLENVVLGFDNLEDYFNHSPYFGAVIGRVAGRIAGGQFELEGTKYTLAQNENNNHLHGGKKGFNDIVWTASVIEKDHEIGVEFTYTSPDGEEGYPGNLDMKVTYTLNNQNEFLIAYNGVSDKTTLLNVTNHSYFNLSGNLKRDILNHKLTLKSDQFLELNEELLPTGEALTVENTPFDFRSGRRIETGVQSSYSQNVLAGEGYDHPFLLNANHQQEIELVDEESGRVLVIETDEPGVVLYTGNQMQNNFEIQGVQSRKYLGLCLETQGLPDAIHHPNFPSIVLEKGKTFNSQTKYTFTLTK